jgi:hypothetical protein
VKNLTRRIEKLEEEKSPQEFEEITICNYMQDVLSEKGGDVITMRIPKKKRKR